MIRALWTSASGMTSQQLNVDTLAHNLSNINTVGFKRSRVDLKDLGYTEVVPLGTGPQSPIQMGHGVKPASTQRCLRAGSLQATGEQLDLAIEGKGYFQVWLSKDDVAYTRDGTFRLDADGEITTASGHRLVISGAKRVPADAIRLEISGDGKVSAITGTSKEEIGQIHLADFPNPSGLESLGGNLFGATEAAGEAISGNPGELGLGHVLQGYVEMSNVDLAQEMVDLIMAQRAYELNSKVLQSADDMLRIANQLRR